MLLRTVLLVVLMFTAIAPRAFSQLIYADFETSLAPLAGAAMEPAGITRTVSGGTVRIQSTNTATLTLDAVTVHGNFTMGVDVVDWADGIGQRVGVSNLGFNGIGVDGYTILLDVDNDLLVLQRVANNIPMDVATDTPAFTLSNANDYRIVMVRLLTATNVVVFGAVYDVADPSSPLAGVSHSETLTSLASSFTVGVQGIVTGNLIVGGATDATFDNFAASDNLASTDADEWTDRQEISLGTDPSDDLDFPFVDMDWVTVGGAGNAADTTSYGAVADAYRIGTYEVTNAQYVIFLNAVAATDTSGLHNAQMSSSPFGGITQAGVASAFFYATKPGRADHPVNYVSFDDALRFANWLHNGQPTGLQDGTTTEGGAYTFTGVSTAGSRNAGAQVFLPSEDQWYKAAYYDVGSATYFDYPVGSDAPTTCAAPTAAANRANCDDPIGDLTDFGSYTGSASPNGTFDQGGNLWEYNEAIIIDPFDPFGQLFNGARGGSFDDLPDDLEVSSRSGLSHGLEFINYGFRVASPAPPITAVPSLSPVGLVFLVGMLSLGCRRRVRA